MTARRLALDALLGVEGGAQADQVLRRAGRKIDRRDAALATELTYGVLRRRRQLDWLIEKAAGRPLSSIQPDIILQILRLGVYQMRFLTRVPAHAAVNETVEMTKSCRRQAAGFVNAVLRRLPQKPKTWPSPAIEYSLPDWIWSRWVGRHGEQTFGIGKAFLAEPRVWVRIPPGVEPPDGWRAGDVPGAFSPPDGDARDFRRQDLGAQSLIPLLDLQSGLRFLDVCAAPGNKTAQAVEHGVRAVGCDSSQRRLRDFLTPGVPLVLADASQALPFGPVFDRILVDAPCSGTGTLGRNPEIRWRLQAEDLPRHAERQKAILRHALGCLRPGGLLLYATCSLEPEENEEVVSEVAGSRVQRRVDRLPSPDSGDGFWAAVIT